MGGRVDEWIRVLSAAVSRAEPATIDRLAVSELVELLGELRAAREEIATLGHDRARLQREFFEAGRKEARREAEAAVGEELAELREELVNEYTLAAGWADSEAPDTGQILPDYYRVLYPDETESDLRVDPSELIGRILARQARAWVRAAELTPAVPLEQLLALVPARYALASRQTDAGHLAWWHLGQAGILAEGSGRDLAAAIRAATIALLRGRQKCETCWNWGREGETGDVRTCLIDPHLLSRSADSSCPDDWRPARWLEPEPGDGEGGQ